MNVIKMYAYLKLKEMFFKNVFKNMLDYFQDDSTKLGQASRGERKPSLSLRSQGELKWPARVEVRLPCLSILTALLFSHWAKWT